MQLLQSLNHLMAKCSKAEKSASIYRKVAAKVAAPEGQVAMVNADVMTVAIAVVIVVVTVDQDPEAAEEHQVDTTTASKVQVAAVAVATPANAMAKENAVVIN